MRRITTLLITSVHRPLMALPILLRIWPIMLLPLTATAQQFSHLNSKDGLAHPSVLSLAQDSIGRIWIGTAEGINVYDGEELVAYKPYSQTDGAVLYPGNLIRKMGCSKEGDIFFKTNRALVRYNIRTGHFSTLIEDNQIAFTVTRRGEVWVANDYMLSRWDAEQEILVPQRKISVSVVYDLVMDRKGEAWIISSRNLFRLKQDNSTDYLTESTQLRRIYEAANGEIWVGTYDEGLMRIDQEGHITRYNSRNAARKGLNENHIRSICEDADGHIWFGTFQGLYQYIPEEDRFRAYTPEPKMGTLSNSSVHAVFVSRENVLWAGTYYGGVNYALLHRRDYRFFQSGARPQEMLSNPIVGDMTQDREGNIWICTEGGGLNMLSPTTGIIRQFKDPVSGQFLPNSNLKAVLYHPESNRLLIGTNGGGLYTYDIDNNRFIPEVGQEKDSPLKSVNDMARSGDTLFLSADMNIYTYSMKSKKSRLLASTMLFANIAFSPHDQSLWSVADDSIHKIDVQSGRILQRYSLKQQGVGCSAIQVFVSQRGELYIATLGNGVMKLSNGRFEPFPSQQSPLLSHYCYRIGQMANGDLVMMGDKGVTLVSELGEPKKSITLGKEFPIDAFTRDCGLMTTPEGNLYIGGTNGLMAIGKAYIEMKEKESEIFFTHLSVHNNPVEPGDGSGILTQTMPFTQEIKLTHEQNRITVRFASTNPVLHHQHIYEYRMDGADSHWYQTTQKSISYTNLAPGHYTLRIRENDKLHQTASPALTLKITVLHPWYTSWWAWLIYLSSVALAVRVAYGIARTKHRFRESMRKAQMEKQQIKEVNEEKFKFFTSVSHEFRTPLTLIIGQLELLQHHTLPPFISSKLKKVTQQCNRLNNLVSELIEFRKYEQGRNKLHVSEQQIGTYIREIHESFRPLAEQQEMNFVLTCDCEDTRVWFDGKQMAKVIYNILSNAFKYTPKGGSVVTTVALTPSGQEVLLTVSDSGVGIGKRDLPYIFERFYQADNPLPNEKQSFRAGIGLALVKSIVEEHGGKIEVSSQVGQGTTFCIHLLLGKRHFEQNEHVVFEEKGKEVQALLPEIILPAEEDFSPIEELDEGGKPSDKRSVGEENPPEVEKPMVLLVEDNQELLQMLKEIFAPLYRVQTACNGKQAYDLIVEKQPDLVVSDVLMPEMTGTELCVSIKKNIELCHIPIVLLTALNLPQHHLEGLIRGADDYVCKPFSPQILLARCGNIIRSRRLLMQRVSREPEAHIALIATNPLDKEFLEKIDAVIEKHTDNILFGVDQLASEMCMGRTSFYNKFKALTGMSPGDYINSFKLKKAATWLKQSPTLSITELAERLGFNTTSYFCRKFKEQFGVTPNQYKKQDEER